MNNSWPNNLEDMNPTGYFRLVCLDGWKDVRDQMLSLQNFQAEFELRLNFCISITVTKKYKTFQDLKWGKRLQECEKIFRLTFHTF